MADKKIPKNPQKFLCNLCDYNTSNIKDYNKHIATRKHKMLTSDLQKIPKNPQKYICDCGKFYKHRQSLCTCSAILLQDWIEMIIIQRLCIKSLETLRLIIL